MDTTVCFPADSTILHLALPVVLEQSPETLLAVIEISAGGVVIFRDSMQAKVGAEHLCRAVTPVTG
ncbi:MAG: hypothetical protein ABIQ41_10035 [Gemmatimonadales bacterium]